MRQWDVEPSKILYGTETVKYISKVDKESRLTHSTGLVPEILQ